MAHPFETDNKIVVDAPPAAVWEAVTTGPGMDAWFMGWNEVEPREGGAVRTVTPAVSMESTVTVWEPPRRFAHEGPEAEDGSVHAFEWRIEERGEGSSAVRWIHSGLLGGDWEADYEVLKEGDPAMLLKLGQYLTFFRGRRATPITAWGQAAGGADGWRIFEQPLGLGTAVALGERVRLTPSGLDPIDGVVDQLSRTLLGVRTDDALFRFAHGFGGDAVFVGHHLYADAGADAQRAWERWLDRTFGEDATAAELHGRG